MKAPFLLMALALGICAPAPVAARGGSLSLTKSKSSRKAVPKKARKKTEARQPLDGQATPIPPADSERVLEPRAEVSAPAEGEPGPANSEPSPEPERGMTSSATLAVEEPEAAGPRASPLDVSLGVVALHRRQEFRDDLFGSLRGFSAPMAPGLRLTAELYPAGFFTRGPASAWGLHFKGEWAGGMRIQDGAGESRPLETYGLSAGVKRRFVFSHLQLGMMLGGSYQRFDLPEPNVRGVNSVSVGYVSVGGGGDARVQITRAWHLAAAVEYRWVMSSGPMAVQFPHASGGVVDATASLGKEILQHTELRLGASLRYYHFSLSPEPGDPVVAGGASDLFASGQLAIAYRL
jgi:hypothetical protein